MRPLWIRHCSVCEISNSVLDYASIFVWLVIMLYVVKQTLPVPLRKFTITTRRKHNEEINHNLLHNIVSWEPEGRWHCVTMFRWEPEGHYRCTKSMEIALFWFSADDIWRISSQKGLYQFCQFEIICDCSCWNIKKVLRKFMILLIITNFKNNNFISFERHYFVLYDDALIMLKCEKWRLTCFAIKLR